MTKLPSSPQPCDGAAAQTSSCARNGRVPRRFLRDETGAVSVDWVVLAAAMVGLVGTTFASLSPVVLNRIGTIFN